MLGSKAPQVYSRLGKIAYRQKNFAEAVDYLEAAIALAPRNANFHLACGDAYLKQKQFDQAIESYQQAIALDPKNVSSYHQLGEAQLAQKQFEAAQRSFQQAIDLGSQAPWVRFRLGRMAQQRKTLAAAIDWYQKAIALNPKNPQFHFHLGTALRQQQDLAAAKASFQAALALNPDFNAATEALNSLESAAQRPAKSATKSAEDPAASTRSATPTSNVFAGQSADAKIQAQPVSTGEADSESQPSSESSSGSGSDLADWLLNTESEDPVHAAPEANQTADRTEAQTEAYKKDESPHSTGFQSTGSELAGSKPANSDADSSDVAKRERNSSFDLPFSLYSESATDAVNAPIEHQFSDHNVYDWDEDDQSDGDGNSDHFATDDSNKRYSEANDAANAQTIEAVKNGATKNGSSNTLVITPAAELSSERHHYQRHLDTSRSDTSRLRRNPVLAFLRRLYRSFLKLFRL